MQYWRKVHEEALEAVKLLTDLNLLPATEEPIIPEISTDLGEANDRVEEALLRLGLKPSTHQLVIHLLDDAITDEIMKTHKQLFRDLNLLKNIGDEEGVRQKTREIEAKVMGLVLSRLGVETYHAEASRYVGAINEALRRNVSYEFDDE